jgi:monofunctional glycosyltransferase
MSPRIEPTLGPASPPSPAPSSPEPAAAEPRVERLSPSGDSADLRVTRFDPAQLQTPQLQAPRRQRPRERFSFIGFLLQLLFVFLALLLLVIVGLRYLPPPTTSYMLQSPVQPVKYQWVPFASIAESMRRAVVASEDQKFWSHHGFDMDAIQKAEAYNRNPHHHLRGASTISQQTAKNLFLWPGGGYFRKGLEAGLTVLIEHLWYKQRILEMYLNIAEFGPGIYGVEAASQAYFGKHAAELSAPEAARLAAVLPDPRHWSARNPGPYVQTRIAWILGQMGEGSPEAPTEEPEPPPLDQDDTAPTALPPSAESPPAPPPPPAANAPAYAPPVEIPSQPPPDTEQPKPPQ